MCKVITRQCGFQLISKLSASCSETPHFSTSRITSFPTCYELCSIVHTCIKPHNSSTYQAKKEDTYVFSIDISFFSSTNRRRLICNSVDYVNSMVFVIASLEYAEHKQWIAHHRGSWPAQLVFDLTGKRQWLLLS